MFPVHYSLQLVEGLGSTHDDAVWRVIISRLVVKLLQAQSEHLYSDGNIYDALHKVYTELDPSETHRRSIVEQLLFEGWACGGSHSALSSRAANPGAAVTDCINCTHQHYQANLNSSQAKKVFEELQFLRGQLTREEQAFEHMVTNSAYVSSPQAMHSARYSGRYMDANQIRTQLPNYLANALSPGNQGQIPVAESDLTPSAPSWLPQALGGRLVGGFYEDMRVNLSLDSTAKKFLQHCSNRELRRTVWSALVQRAATHSFGGATGQHASNEQRIENLRNVRGQVAKQLGFPDWLHAVWHRNLPGARGPESPTQLVDDVLEPMRKQLLPVGMIEWKVLNEWAAPYLRIPSEYRNLNPRPIKSIFGSSQAASQPSVRHFLRLHSTSLFTQRSL